MNTAQLQRVLSQNTFTKKYFLDVFPSDQLPMQITKFPTCFIANVDSSGESGSHWLAFYISTAHNIEFFDSYGNAPTFFEGDISDYVSSFPNVKYNPQMLQSNATAVCGQYCIYYLYTKCRGRTLKDFLSSFINKHICNDLRVYNFVAKRFHVYANFYQ
jgi:hypothetical protein